MSANRADRAHLIEIFSGIQGEGLLVGERMIFCRFTGCNLTCDYCDTPMTRPLDTVVRIERTAGLRDFDTADNPVSRAQVLGWLRDQAADPHLHRWITFTGGEPLLYAPFLDGLLDDLAADAELSRLSVYLETNGTLAAELDSILDRVDRVAMDWKETCDGAADADHAAFLETAVRARADVFVKSVVRTPVDAEHYARIAAAVAAVDRAIPFILQPVTPYGPVTDVPTPAEMLGLQRSLLGSLDEVRVIPQTHKFIGQL